MKKGFRVVITSFSSTFLFDGHLMETKKRGWKMVKLEEVLKHRKGFIQIDDLEKYKLCRVQTSARGVVLRSEVLGSEIRTKKQQVCKAGDFLVAEIDAKMGGYGIVPEDLEGAIVSSHYFLYDIIEDKLDKTYLEFFTQTPRFFEQVKAEGSTNYAAIRPSHVLAYEIPLPPLSEQQHIAGRLAALKGKIDAVRALRGEQVREVERIEGQFLNDLFDSLMQKIGTQPIEKVAVLERGRFGHRPRNAPHLYENGMYPFIQTGEVSRAKGGKIEYSQMLNEEGLKVSRLFKPNTVLMTIAANIGNTAILDYEACFPDSVVSIRPKEGLDIYFLDYYLRGQKDYLNAIAPQSAQKNINVQILSTLKIPVPPISEQRRIVSEIKAFQTQMEALKAAQAGQLSALEGLFPGVLEQAFRGEW